MGHPFYAYALLHTHAHTRRYFEDSSFGVFAAYLPDALRLAPKLYLMRARQRWGGEDNHIHNAAVSLANPALRILKENVPQLIHVYHTVVPEWTTSPDVSWPLLFRRPCGPAV